ncbi:MAG: hypothetical protein DRG50_01960 [Deltaproteobacteria bacterium]|nr:MAG: hypothetical protein DRG50_01960 [Deltaproteobacteria bacterium]
MAYRCHHIRYFEGKPRYSSGEKGGRFLKVKGIVFLFLLSLIFAFISLGLSSAQQKNLSVNEEVTLKIRSFDREFFKDFDVYSAGVKEAPTALLFDLKDDYQLPSKFWGPSLNEEEIIYAIKRLDDQYIDRTWDLPFEPRALNIVNRKGEILGYIYTSMNAVLMDRKRDGRVTIYLPVLQPQEGDGGEWRIRPKP